MRSASPARFLAPLAIVAFIVVLVVVVSGAGGGSQPSRPAAGGGGAAPRATTSGHHRGRHKGKRTYTVKSGDSLSRIAAKTGVPVRKIEALNPDTRSRTLHPGEKLKLSR